MHNVPMVLADFSGIGSDIAKGAAGAMWGIVSAIPFWVWCSLFGGLVVFGIAMRYLTNIKVDIALAVIFVIVTSAFAWRAHFIEEGYTEAQAQVKAAQVREAGYKATEALIIACYGKDSMALTYVWDRTDGQCKRVDGGQ